MTIEARVERLAGDRLTRRQLQIAAALATGASSAAIAASMHLSERTAENHVAAIFKKLQLTSRAQFMAALLRSAEPASNAPGVPSYSNAFVGRKRELEELSVLLPSARLLSIVGTAGVGKTRIAVELVQRRAHTGEQTFYFVDLAAIGDASLVLAAVLSALGAGRSPGDQREALLAFLERRCTTVVLDNCEHVRDAAGSLAEAILTRAPRVSLVATSRTPLRISEETIYELSALSLPDPAVDWPHIDVAAHDAIELFVRRAQETDARFALTEANAPFVADVCRRLDGIALAIELAAARTNVLHVREVSRKLSERFRLLRSETQAHARHHTMQATLDWSHALLGEPERALFRSLCVFAGSFSLEAARTVANLEHPESLETQLQALIDSSLLNVERTQYGVRHRFLESMRQYGRERLRELGLERTLDDRHARYYLELAHRFRDAWEITPELEFLAAVDRELDNIRSAVEWCLGEGHEPVRGASTLGALLPYWSKRRSEALPLFKRARAQVNAQMDAALNLRLLLGMVYTMAPSGDEYENLCREAMETARAMDDEVLLASALAAYGLSRRSAHDHDEALSATGEARNLFRKLGLRRSLAQSLITLATLQRVKGNFSDARKLFGKALALGESLQSHTAVSNACFHLARLELDEGNVEAAIICTERGLEADLLLNDETLIAESRDALAWYHILCDRLGVAYAYARDALFTWRGLDPHKFACSIEMLAYACARSGELELAGTLRGYARVHEVRPQDRNEASQHCFQRLEAFMNASLAPALLDSLQRDAESMSEPDALALVLSAQLSGEAGDRIIQRFSRNFAAAKTTGSLR